ncbi:hypothetical protein [[Flexibacter] sp. ATCC 35208]|uniref:hypothetical protein n=1 Tax=[Flexibacter] sp. ATCC 35208 TaxID=1936242 RepID=UPI0009CC2279|nr:hypothetical protein [[Flexibacter] sp. ATCC 35208]OMP74617.1 hypothetical protein BW716_34395 [[Flexibacter] sp. ATCC 35208]
MSCNEYPDSAYFPQNLRTEKIKDPYLILYEFFDYSELPRIRSTFWEFFKATVTGKFNKESYKYVRVSIVELFEQIQKLIEAAHLINEDYKEKRKLQINGGTDIQHISNYGKKPLEEKIVKIIKEAVKPKRIYSFCDGHFNSENGPNYDYLIVVPEDSHLPFDEMKKLIEEARLELPPILFSFIKENQLVKGLDN